MDDLPGFTIDDGGAVRIDWHEPDWFGPGVPSVPDGVEHSVRAESDHLVFRLQATRDLEGLATGRFDQPGVAWPVFSPAERLDGGVHPAARALAYVGCEFALPTRARADLDGWATLPGRPATAWPLIVRAPDGRTVMLAPLDSFHDQTIGINGGTIRCGWHGDLEGVPAGFATELAVIGGDGPRACLERWGRMLQHRAGTRRPGRAADALAARPSYWTDNGAAYWYRTEPGHDAAGSIVAAVDDLRDRGVRLGAVQLDSWFYPHATLRPFDTDEWEVPPTPMLAWEERPDVLPAGLSSLRHRLGDPPLVAHIRHLAATASMADEVPVAIDGAHAVPTTPAAYERWLDQCVSWGVETFEHDWLVEVFHRNRWLRARPGRARAWQEGIDAAARERGITLQWCMATPADFAQTVTLSQVTSIRTSGDHGYLASPGQLWAWFCTTNALARALGLTPFKDVFRTDPEVAGHTGEVEALLSALSTGPVGLGDRVGRTDVDVVMRCCRADGIVVRPDVAVAATDDSLLAAGRSGTRPMVADTWSDHPAGRWVYVVAMHCRADDRLVADTVSYDSLPFDTLPSDTLPSDTLPFDTLTDAVPVVDAIAWDWRTGSAVRVGPGWDWVIELEREEWAYLVLAPVLDGWLAVIGDVSKFATVGRERLEIARRHQRSDTVVDIVVKGAGETVRVTGWAAVPPVIEGCPSSWVAATGCWTADVVVPDRGWRMLTVRRPDRRSAPES